ncbi:tripartite tricarboxylate transporter substrate binding protein [Verticiella sediminum]|uniref:Tripartite tricarboxylate transporter substrate binding protein n=1 Tax=Verticiella sediminum TaxID=1247510 RepID=A0A556AYS5_9BURK|nr:tripartite tricarboxylate transporter substrate binding protein [Verticiella sediminum]TSH98093.1 tripartite tricarboxylate transporter substrate binding protein [Verticiella sediminum]
MKIRSAIPSASAPGESPPAPLQPRSGRRTVLRGVAAVAALAALGGAWRPAVAQTFDKPVRILVPFTAGGASDTVSRALAADLQGRIGQPVIVENRPGASGTIALDQMQRSAADGTTLMLLSGSTTLAPAFEGKHFDVERNVTALGMLYTQKLVLVTSAGNPRTGAMRNATDVAAYAKANPDVLTFASSSPGTMGHLVMERFKSTAGLRMTHVPYKGSPQAVLDLIAGRVDFFLADSTSTMPYVREGKLRPLAIAGAERLATLPEVPTFQEQGYADLLPGIWAGIVGPPNLPPATVDALAAQIKAGFDTPSFQERLLASGNEPWYLSPADMLAYVKENTQTWSDFIREQQITIR